MLSALQSQQEGLHTPTLRMVPVAGTMMLFEAKEDTLGNLGTGEQDGQAHAPSPPLTRGFYSPHTPIFHRMVRGDPRAIVEYRDLDAPDDVDFF